MFTKVEMIASLLSGVVVGVVGMSVIATTFWTSGGAKSGSEAGDLAGSESRHMYELSDAFLTCRDQVVKEVPHKARNVNIDFHSSHYQADSNSNIVFLDLEIIEKPGTFYSKSSYDARILCQVSAANNEVTNFEITRG